MKHRSIPARFSIKTGIHGSGVFLTQNIKKGKTLFKMKGEILDKPTRTSVQIGKNKHIEDIIASRVNHSCTPNTKVCRQHKTFISLTDIKKGEEITFNYNKNEDSLASPFKCKCCGNKIMGKTNVKPNALKALYAFLKKYERTLKKKKEPQS